MQVADLATMFTLLILGTGAALAVGSITRRVLDRKRPR